MDWSAIWEYTKDWGAEFLKVIGGSSIIVGAACWLFRKVISAKIDLWYDKKNKDYQEAIDKKAREHQTRLDKQLADHNLSLDDKSKEIQSKLDTQLELARVEYGTLYTKRLDVIIELHKWMLLFCRYAELTEAMSSSDSNKMIKLRSELTEDQLLEMQDFDVKKKEFNIFVDNNRIYFSRELAGIIQGIPVQLLFLFVNLQQDNISEIFKDDERSEEINAGAKEFSEHYERMKSDNCSFKDILNFVEDEFRHLIGANITRN